MRHQHGRRRHGRHRGLWRRFGRRSPFLASTVPRVLRRPAAVTLVRRIESRRTHSERFAEPRINVVVNLSHGATRPVDHGLGRPLAVRLPASTQATERRDAGRLMRPPAAATRVQRPAATQLRPSLAAPAQAALNAVSVGAVRRQVGRRGQINAPAARTIALSEPPSPGAHRTLGVADARSPNGERRLKPADAETANGASVDIERLTDRVVAAIDRRLWSHRERMGGR